MGPDCFLLLMATLLSACYLCEIEVVTNDPLLRRASARYEGTEFQTITGMSGAPVFDLTAGALCGMVMRGTFQNGLCEVRYADIHDIVRHIEAIRTRTQRSFYFKP
jgi:hypothetical protein